MTELLKPIIKALRGDRVDPPPIWLMRQAGRYLPEYRSVRSVAKGFLNLCYDPNMAADITLQPIKRFGLDAAILFSDILVLPDALGQKVEFVEGEGPVLEGIRTPVDVGKLSIENIHNHLEPIYQAIEEVSGRLPSDTALIGFAGAPWTVATYMVEGGSSRHYPYVKGWALSDPESFQELISLLIEATASYLIRQVQAGAEVLQLFDTWAGVLPKDAFYKYSAQPIREIAKRVKNIYQDIPIIAFPRGAALYLPELVRATEINGIGIDYTTDPYWAARELQPHAVVQGNLDPTLLLAGGKELEHHTRDIIEALSNGPHIFNLGHGVLPSTPVEHVEHLIKLVRE